MTNPVLVNDLRKNLFRRKPVVATAMMAAVIMILTLGVSAAFPDGTSWQFSNTPLWRFLDFALPVIATAFAAGAFAKEHEQRTWQDVLLTRLSTGEILSGKFFASLLPTLMTLFVLSPPFYMMLLVQNVRWAWNPGPWMLVIGFKFLVSIIFYIAVVMVCSYHSATTRTALAVGYVILALYGLFNYALWMYFLLPAFVNSSPRYDSYMINYNGSNVAYYRYENPRMPWEVSTQQFNLSPVEWLSLAQSTIFGILLFAYLAYRLRRR